MAVPDACQPIADEIAALEQERNDLGAELQQAPTGQKARLAAQIKALNSRIAILSNQLADCLRDTPPPPAPPPPLQATFAGTATITTTNPSAAGPFTSPILLGLIFDGARTFVAITSFRPIATAAFPTLAGMNVTTVSRTGGGQGSYAGGAIRMPLILHFDHSIDVPFFEEDSDLSVLLTTDPPGSPVDASGSVNLAGSGTFGGGFLGGATGTLSIVGAISPVP
jgi:hypothetical protein